MIDGVPYAAGSGYLLKAISSFLASYPTYSDFVSALVAGTLPIDISFNSAGWSIQPTPLNKANLLDDTVAATLKTLAGLSSNPATPNAAFSALATAVAGGAKIATGSYTGNGLYGSSHPCSLTFNFAPKVVLIYAGYTSGAWYWNPFCNSNYNSVSNIMVGDMLTTNYVSGTGFFVTYTSSTRSFGKKSADGKTFSWYNPDSASQQFNDSGSIFYALAIG